MKSGITCKFPLAESASLNGNKMLCPIIAVGITVRKEGVYGFRKGRGVDHYLDRILATHERSFTNLAQLISDNDTGDTGTIHKSIGTKSIAAFKVDIFYSTTFKSLFADDLNATDNTVKTHDPATAGKSTVADGFQRRSSDIFQITAVLECSVSDIGDPIKRDACQLGALFKSRITDRGDITT